MRIACVELETQGSKRRPRDERVIYVVRVSSLIILDKTEFRLKIEVLDACGYRCAIETHIETHLRAYTEISSYKQP